MGADVLVPKSANTEGCGGRKKTKTSTLVIERKSFIPLAHKNTKKKQQTERHRDVFVVISSKDTVE